LALTTESPSALNQVYNVASGTSISISKLFNTLRDLLAEKNPEIALVEPILQPARVGDILHSSASIEKARTLLGFNPETDPHRALAATVEAYWAQHV